MQQLLLSIILCFATNAVRAGDLWATAVSIRPTDGWKIVHRFIADLATPAEIQNLPTVMTLRWQYQGSQGMPSEAQLKRAYQFEDAIQAQLVATLQGKLVLISTGNNQRRWIYYTNHAAQFRHAATLAAQAAQLALNISDEPDPTWALLSSFKARVQQ
ncbi:DUF695 domain-containing protein [Chitinibacter tainanensis]|uniref:DUF695 domain-containing protein n=1 Tax=Chitinibacter tainanensis TaxID=230667 RepID=UPI002355C734|nr:DUF695 domain-containing protein [Chitinibacter tainanensis]